MITGILNKLFQVREKADGDIEKPFLEHMEDLRWTLIKVATVVFIAMISSFTYRQELMQILQGPLASVDPTLPGTLMITGIADSFMLSIRMAFYCGMVVAFPFIVYFIAEFILPALTRAEKRYLFPGILLGTILFIAGVLGSYYYVLPETLKFFWKDAATMQIRPQWTWTAYASFASWLTIGFGLLCELPVAVIMLALLGVVSFRFLSNTRSYAITIILILACIIAPTPDPVTFLTLGTPVVLLYEVCIWVVWFIERARGKKQLETDGQ